MRIELDQVHRSYPLGANQVPALAAVTLSIVRPQFVAVVGPSGAGKSTLLHLLGGLDKATAGTVAVDGRDLATMNDDDLAGYRRSRVGFVFQSFNLLARLTVEENVAVPCLLGGVRPAAARQRARQALSLVGLDDLGPRRAAELSGGQMQRVAIARALVMDPPLLLADEPTGNLDSASGDQIVELLRAQTGAGRTVVVVTHNERVSDGSDRTIRLADGRVVADLEPGGDAGTRDHPAEPALPTKVP